MKHWKLHLWLLINILVVSYLLIEPSVLRTSFIYFTVLIIFSAFILKHEVKLNEQFAKEISLKDIIPTIGLVLFGYMTVRVSRQLKGAESESIWMTDAFIQYGLSAFILFLVICYIFSLRKKIKIEGEANRKSRNVE